MKRKWKEARGETVVEVLASVLICALSVALLVGGIMAGASMDTTTRGLDEEYYTYLSAAEAFDAAPMEDSKPIEGILRITRTGILQDIAVELYGGSEMYSYKAEETGP